MFSLVKHVSRHDMPPRSERVLAVNAPEIFSSQERRSLCRSGYHSILCSRRISSPDTEPSPSITHRLFQLRDAPRRCERNPGLTILGTDERAPFCEDDDLINPDASAGVLQWKHEHLLRDSAVNPP